MRCTLFLVALQIHAASSVGAQVPPALKAATIVAREVDGWFYSDGVMKQSLPTFELVYEVTDSSLVRRTIRNLITGEVLTDNTTYVLLRNVPSFQQNRVALLFKKLTDQERAAGPVIRAIGQPGSEAVEVLYVGHDWMQSVKTLRDYMVISRYRRSQ